MILRLPAVFHFRNLIIIKHLLILGFISLLFPNEIISTVSDTSQQKKQNILFEKMEMIHRQMLADSIKKSELEKQLILLNVTDQVKIAELKKQLQELKDKEKKRIEIKKAHIDSMKISANSAPVMGLLNDTLFLIYSRIGSFSESERAAAISQRIANLAKNYILSIDSITIIETEITYDIVVGERIIMSITENDALWNNSTRNELGLKYLGIIKNALIKYRTETSLATLLSEIGLVVLILIIFSLLIFLINKLFAWIKRRVEDQDKKLINGVKFKNYTLLEAQHQVKFLLQILTYAKYIVYLIMIYLTIPILLGVFPWTQHLADKLLGYILNPIKNIATGIWLYLPNLITILVIAMVFRYILKFIHFISKEIENEKLIIPGFYSDWANPTYHIVRIILVAFMIVVIYPYIPGSDSAIFKGVSVFIGFLFTFTSAGSLSNIIAGLVLTYMRLFTIGDRVKIGDVTGDIIEKSLLVTRIRTIKNEIVSIPNSTIMNSSTINYSSDALNKGLILHTTITIGYDAPWRDLHKALIDAALKTEFILKNPAPFVLQTSLDDFYVSYQINAYTNEPNKQIAIYSELHQNIQDVCNERGIEIMSPHYKSIRDGNMTTIPANYLSGNEKVPGFNININKSND